MKASVIGNIFLIGKRTFKVFCAFLSIKHIQISKEIVKYGIDWNKIKYNNITKKIFFCELGISFPSEKSIFLIKGYSYAKLLKNEAGAEFSISENEDLIVKINSLKFFVQTEEELYILKEIFLDGIYNVIDDGDNVIIDIGMNVGFASLYLSSRRNRKIYSFEPFKPTYDQALRNLKLNPQLISYIEHYNFGLGEKNETLVVDYLYEQKGNMSTSGIPQWIPKNGNETTQETIIIKNAKDILKPILESHLGFDFILKIDCEGAEYAIINLLNKENLLYKIKSMMIEWHSKGPEPIIDILGKAGFTIFSFTPLSKSIGMIYAVRSNIN